MRTSVWVLMFIVFSTGIFGCQQANQISMDKMEQKPKIYTDIIWVSLSVQMPYLDEDNDQYPDGVVVDVMLNRPGEKGFIAGRGTLIVHLLRRARDEKGILNDKELYKWTILEDEFLQSIVRQRFGLICHHMALYWHGIPQPKGNGLYLQAEFIRTDKKQLISRMVALTIPDKK
jgi:hypothetical protein